MCVVSPTDHRVHQFQSRQIRCQSLAQVRFQVASPVENVMKWRSHTFWLSVVGGSGTQTRSFLVLAGALMATLKSTLNLAIAVFEGDKSALVCGVSGSSSFQAFRLETGPTKQPTTSEKKNKYLKKHHVKTLGNKFCTMVGA